MTLERPLSLLLLLALPALWLWLRRGGSRAAFLLKCAVFIALVIALADPWAELDEERLAVTVVVDNSASMSRAGGPAGAGALRELARRNPDAELRLITFASGARLHNLPRDAGKIAVPEEPEATASGTDLESALHLALSTFPPGGARRVLLISDGKETRGRSLTAALRARERGVPVHTLTPAAGAGGVSFQVEDLALPQQVFSGERFTVSMRVNSSRAAGANIALICQGRQIGAAPVRLEAGGNQVDVDARITGTGVSLLEGRIRFEEPASSAPLANERVLFSQAVSVRRPRLLYIYGGAPPLGGSGGAAFLADTLKRAQVDVETGASFPVDAARSGDPERTVRVAEPGQRWDAVLMDNYPDHRLAPAESAAIEKYVAAGGGLVFISGQHNSRIAEDPREPFEKLLPVRGDPEPAPDETTAVVLVLDKSASMDGLKIAMAREAGRASLVTLRPVDKIGVLAFDSSFRWVVPLAPASDIARITSAIGSISADGGTSIYPALAAAYQTIRTENAARKHIILLTDGWSTPGEFAKLSQDAAQERITISTVGVGKEVNRTLLENVAREARGKSYFVENPEMIPQIISGEVRELSASPIRERPFRAVALRPLEFTDGVDFTRAPRLLGYVKVKARPGSETILRTDNGEPLMVRWQYGLGRVIVFLSDAKNRWGAEWLGWNAYGTLWPQLVRDACRGSRTVRAGVRPGARDGEAIVYYDVAMQLAATSAQGGRGAGPEQSLRDSGAGPEQSLRDSGRQSGPRLSRPGRALERPRVVVSVPGEQPRTLALEETAPGHYEARIPAAERGLYRIVSGSSELLLPEAGFFRDSDELRQREPNAALLREIGRLTGGESGAGDFRPMLGPLLDPDGALIRSRKPLWPYWLLLALALNFLEVALRKGMFARLAPALAGLRSRAPRLRGTGGSLPAGKPERYAPGGRPAA